MACYWGKCGDMAIQRVREDGMLLGKMSIPKGCKNITLRGDRVTWLQRGYIKLSYY
jgi:sugar lactone lactonase YvrE